MVVKLEFTGPDTPQYNGKIERRFATLYGRVRAILNEAKVPEEMRNKLWAKHVIMQQISKIN